MLDKNFENQQTEHSKRDSTSPQLYAEVLQSLLKKPSDTSTGSKRNLMLDPDEFLPFVASVGGGSGGGGQAAAGGASGGDQGHAGPPAWQRPGNL